MWDSTHHNWEHHSSTINQFTEMEKENSESKDKDRSVSKTNNDSESEDETQNEKSSTKVKFLKVVPVINEQKEDTRSKSKDDNQVESSKSEENNEKDISTSKTFQRASSDSKQDPLPPSSSKTEEEEIEIEDTELEDKIAEGTLELEELQTRSKDADEDISSDVKENEETAVPLLVGESVSIDMQGKSPSVHVHTKESKGGKPLINESVFQSPIPRLRNSWNKSTNVCDFLSRLVLIVFSTLGWILCSGGLPFVSIAMFITGSVYIDDCKVQPNIPIYLIVGGVCGTIQHFISFWNKCLPESRQGRLSSYKIYYSAVDGAMTLFLLIWFIIGCAWVYGVKDVEFQDKHKDEYCHKTVYYFAFWLLNINFILISLVAVLCIGLLLFVIAFPKESNVV